MLYLGIDLHRKQIAISLRDETGDAVIRRQVSTRPEKTIAFLQQVREMAGEAGYYAAVEVCGFHEWLCGLLREHGCRQVVLVHPAQAGKRKTDRRDANRLSELLWNNRRRLARGERLLDVRQVVEPTAEEAHDRQLTALRKRLGGLRTQTVNKLQNILRKHNLTWEQPTKCFDTQAVRKWLSDLELPECDRLEMDLLLQQWKLWGEQLERVEKQIQRRARNNQRVAILRTAPGVSDYSGLALASRIGDVRRFPSPRSLANYFGLTPGSKSTGDAQRLGSITKEGSAMARFLLGQLVLHVLRRDRAMREFYQRLRRRRGSKIARVAVMRRLTTIFWHMLTHQEAYCVGGPPRLKYRRSPHPPGEEASLGLDKRGRERRREAAEAVIH